MKQLLEKMPEELIEFLKSAIWPFFSLIVVILLIIFFRKQLAELIRNTTGIEVDPRNRKFRIDFKQQVSEAKAQSLGIEKTVAAGGIATPDDKVRDFKQQTARDAVLESWGGIKQIVYDVCVAKNIQLTPATVIGEAVRRLLEVSAIDSEVANVINVLYALGDTLANDTSLRPAEDDARAYRGLADILRNWMMLNLLSSVKGEAPQIPSEKPRSRRETLVGSDKPIIPAHARKGFATLIGTGGSVKDRVVSMGGEMLRIGRNADNDVSIPNDDFVSGSHACLSFKNGRLLLYDNGSRNGTFLNKRPVSDSPQEVAKGDSIQVGNAIFQVAEINLPTASAGEKPVVPPQRVEQDTVVR